MTDNSIEPTFMLHSVFYTHLQQYYELLQMRKQLEMLRCRVRCHRILTESCFVYDCDHMHEPQSQFCGSQVGRCCKVPLQRGTDLARQRAGFTLQPCSELGGSVQSLTRRHARSTCTHTQKIFIALSAVNLLRSHLDRRRRRRRISSPVSELGDDLAGR